MGSVRDGRHRHAVNVRADGLAEVLGPLMRDPTVRAALLVDIDSGMVLDACGPPGGLTVDSEQLGAVHADLMRLALGPAVGAGDGEPWLRDGSCEIVVGLADSRHLVLRRIPDPYGDRLALSVLVDGPSRVPRRIHRRLREVSTAALTAGPTTALRPVAGAWRAPAEREVAEAPARPRRVGVRVRRAGAPTETVGTGGGASGAVGAPDRGADRSAVGSSGSGGTTEVAGTGRAVGAAGAVGAVPAGAGTGRVTGEAGATGAVGPTATGAGTGRAAGPMGPVASGAWTDRAAGATGAVSPMATPAGTAGAVSPVATGALADRATGWTGAVSPVPTGSGATGSGPTDAARSGATGGRAAGLREPAAEAPSPGPADGARAGSTGAGAARPGASGGSGARAARPGASGGAGAAVDPALAALRPSLTPRPRQRPLADALPLVPRFALAIPEQAAPPAEDPPAPPAQRTDGG